MLELKSVSFAYKKEIIFDDLSHSFNKGEITSVVGASGVGKSTLFALLSGQRHPGSGHIYLDGMDLTNLPPNRRPVITMFQTESLFPHMTIYENIRFPLVSKFNRERFKAVDHERYINEKLQEVNLQGFGDRLPETLSGGQNQRATLARSLAAKPEILLLDEPFSALNEELKYNLNRELAEIIKANDIIALKITHDLYEATNFSDKILYIDDGKSFLFKTSNLETLSAPAMVIEYFMLGILAADKKAYVPIGALNEDDGELSFDCQILSALKQGGIYEYTLLHNEQRFKYFSHRAHENKITLHSNHQNKISTLRQK